MSFQAMTWAMSRPVSNAGQKLVLLMLANHSNFHTGQCNPSHKLLANECAMGISTLKGHIQALQDFGYITIVHKYVDSVQLPNQYKLNFDGVSQNLTEVGSESDGGVGQNLATNLEDKPRIQPKENVFQENALFETFWKAYPKKTGKDLARVAFAKRKVNNELLATMLKAIAQQKNVDQWKKDNGQFIPNPTTWLNQGRWQDEITTIVPDYMRGLV
ncbi:Helix-turn-helix domain containing protein [uncultured Caudovirales phage]|uniref:Helix-turn-helix domain containing protein n=1 Tax=uncultured Caudovirales phage TaxID=2100421 RepID=A0A6J5MWA7_9CAUD|nr:Helix-turn-helix domain containing protein [uncultured Caudovirales phage]CAB4150622.1 Helix-turn-helix domain containing protein [uncultured Caudovirales phage]